MNPLLSGLCPLVHSGNSLRHFCAQPDNTNLADLEHDKPACFKRASAAQLMGPCSLPLITSHHRNIMEANPSPPNFLGPINELPSPVYMFVFLLPNTSNLEYHQNTKVRNNKNKTSSTAKGTKGQETEVALYLTNPQPPNACPSLSRRCSTMQSLHRGQTEHQGYSFVFFFSQYKSCKEKKKSRHWKLLM